MSDVEEFEIPLCGEFLEPGHVPHVLFGFGECLRSLLHGAFSGICALAYLTADKYILV